MIIITIFIVFTNNRLYMGRSSGPSCIWKDPFYFYEITSNSKEIKEKRTFIC